MSCLATPKRTDRPALDGRIAAVEVKAASSVSDDDLSALRLSQPAAR
jgi:hypothetical protein